MTSHESAFEAAQRACWMRPDAYRWIRPDAVRFLAPGTDPREVYPALQRKFNPDQPRVPAGNPDAGGGRMAAVAVSSRFNIGRASDPLTCWKSAAWVATPSKGMSA
ncbi:hypothetical protein Nwi_1164 [Nitrobacter winogradskyi Nb-255]|uniref:Uncharacterized protein n=1 Tax=Nitrobacter winogradskyi (strain ATCC 25391 / DSM 10237 / CIP 104748 / NCIMB 11846 / Nb-255) TaxID=323098 RepID=Q3STG5_NITWN|nr:hypothetical protein [Nitrobacter winogradskyi]ABA04426.1 hypothetical protein Nwi_1164 [Nitrobacter winogradskyi Nb-255]